MTRTRGQAEAARALIVTRLRAAGCVFAEDEARLLVAAAASPAELESMVERRAGGLPLEQVIGWAKFCGLRIAVEPGVFVPRHRSELLVREAVALAAPGAVVLDLGCGSGAVGAAVAAAVPGIELHAVDVDPVAVRCARRNLDALGGRVYEGDLYAPLPAGLRGRVGLVVANAPYVPSGELDQLPREARLFEPVAALDGGRDGLDVVRRVAAGAAPWLAPAGHVLVETGEHQAATALGILTDCGLDARRVTSAELEATVCIGSRRLP